MFEKMNMTFKGCELFAVVVVELKVTESKLKKNCEKRLRFRISGYE